WGIASLILIIGVVGIYFILQPDPEPEPEKVYNLPSEAELKKARKASEKAREASKTSINNISENDGKVSDADIEKLLQEIAAEEKDVKEALSAEEMAKRESRRKAKELWEKIGKIIQDAGGSIHTSTHPEEVLKVVRLLEGSEGPTMFTQMNNFGKMFQDSMNENGDIKTSELLRMAKYMEEVLGNNHEAILIRNMAQYGVIKGYDVINLREIMSADDYEEVLKEHYESTK
ncbi:hypothetical protein J5I95_22570, partial [Candidatus Poribacteria bacterium]|nr:hypothetical protein [Candidatus Poribacteria bacterium]